MRTTAHRVAAELVKVLADNGLRDAVVSPGSRNAPLVIALYHEPRIRLTVAIDERSAAHIALGMALATRRPAAAVSTSGTAAVNHGPALAEAFHARVPLLSLTADRPVASRDRGHGQTARQAHLFATPFYYIDYALAEVAALQLWQRARTDHAGALEAYMAMCAVGGTVSLLGMLARGGLRSPFDPEVLPPIVAEVAAELAL